MTIEKCRTCKSAFTTGKDVWYCKKLLADKDDCGEYEMTDKEYDEFMTKCTNIPYKDYSWLKEHCYRTLKRPCSPNARNEHLAVLDLIREHEERQWIPVSEGLPEENETVIASTEYRVFPEARYTKEYGWEWAYESGADYWRELPDVTAWMPLPKKYEPQESEVEK